jgi:hypothetical protein
VNSHELLLDRAAEIGEREARLIAWLADAGEDWSPLASCVGPTLDKLVDLGLAEHSHAPPYSAYTGVRLTSAGAGAAAQLREAAP